ncbi:hypothetical protein QTH87_21395 [Variovorax sp. J22P168]|uniref:hypothetical protein n=1 Tax=Variovorax jilinensis TaxID=3053513 RepID=UPI0025780DFA|nr:hypothetical protein [Variovorax sp. J22P168]MDM0015015.1 hypothetical protein [Variovorax sp. J22P168]
MSWFTRLLVAAVVLLFTVAAVGMSQRGAYKSALMSLGFALFFAGIGVVALIEAKHLPRKQAPGAPRLNPWSSFGLLWRAPGWGGKFAVIFCGGIILAGVLFKAISFFH